MSRATVAIFSLILVFGYLQVYWSIKNLDSVTPVLAAKVRELSDELKRAEMRELVQLERFQAYQQEVAALLPESLLRPSQSEGEYPLRKLASVMVKASPEKVETLAANSLFETGRSYFKKGEYEKANRLFKKLIQNYGYSPNAIEAHFLLSEGLYQLGQLDESTDSINQMVELFPESELTGFALIRLGNILESHDRTDEAVKVYRTVLRTFPYRAVSSQAALSLKQMENQ